MNRKGKPSTIKVVVVGAAGRMGQESVKAILQAAPELQLVGAVGQKRSPEIGQDIGEIVGQKPIGIPLSDNLKDCLQRSKPDVMLDFTVPSAVFMNACIGLDCGLRVIVGATGLSTEDLRELEKKANYYSSAVLVAPNFALGAILLIEAAKLAAKHFSVAEIIEMHHDKKVDAPSGTAVKTARELSHHIAKLPKELSPNAQPRGQAVGNVRVHSVRLPGLLAHQEVIFGGVGQTLSMRHDTFDRTAFMPGVLMAIKKIGQKQGLIYGLEHLLD